MNCKMKDVIIIGAGPAGMTAASYASEGGLSVTLLERGICGGQMAVSSVIDNYPGVGMVSGYELCEMMLRHVEERGIVPVSDAARRIEALPDGFKVTGDADEYYGRCVIIASGVKRREAGFDGERKYVGRGVSYCAVCDGMFFKGAEVCVIGGGNSALEEALYLSGICEKVYLVHRRESFRGEVKYVDAVKKRENIIRMTSHRPIRVWGDSKVEGIELHDDVRDAAVKLSVNGVFVAVGLVPDNVCFADAVKLTEDGYVLAGEDCKTSTRGIFVCGDCRQKTVRQIATAVGDGAVAATSAVRYLREEVE